MNFSIIGLFMHMWLLFCICVRELNIQGLQQTERVPTVIDQWIYLFFLSWHPRRPVLCITSVVMRGLTGSQQREGENQSPMYPALPYAFSEDGNHGHWDFGCRSFFQAALFSETFWHSVSEGTALERLGQHKEVRKLFWTL